MNMKAINTDKSELRKFGILFSIILLVLFDGLLPWWRGLSPPLWPVFVGAPILTLALLWPAMLRIPYAGWMKFGAVMGFINTHIIMGVFFFSILTPIGCLMRLFGKDTLVRRFDYSLPSYRNVIQPRTKEHLERPY